MAKRLEIQDAFKKLKRLIIESKDPMAKTSEARKELNPIDNFIYLLDFDKIFFSYLTKEDVEDTFDTLLAAKRTDELLEIFKQDYLIIGNKKTNTKICDLLINDGKELNAFSNIVVDNAMYLEDSIFERGMEEKYVSACFDDPKNLVKNNLIEYIFTNTDDLSKYNKLLLNKYEKVLDNNQKEEVKKVLDLILICMVRTRDYSQNSAASKCYNKINEIEIERLTKQIKLKLR